MSITLPDTTPPAIASFSMPATAASTTVSVSSFTATDNVGVTGYLINESSSTPSLSDPNWSGSAPATYTFSGSGSRTAYAWAKDGAGNISSSASATVDLTGITYYINYDDGSDSNTGYSTSSSWGTIDKFILYPGLVTPTTGVVTSTNQITFNGSLQITLLSGASIAIPINTIMTASTTIDFSQMEATSTVSISDIPSGYSSKGIISFGDSSHSLSSNNPIVIQIPINSSYNGLTLVIFRKEPGESWINTGITCAVSNGICQFTTTQLSEFSASLQNENINTSTTAAHILVGAGLISAAQTSAATPTSLINQETTTTMSSSTSTLTTATKIITREQILSLISQIQQKINYLISQLNQINAQKVIFSRDADFGTTGWYVKMLQLRLQNLGFFPKNQRTTGYFGQITKNSLILFQKSNNISQTGVFDSSTRRVMNGE